MSATQAVDRLIDALGRGASGPDLAAALDAAGVGADARETAARIASERADATRVRALLRALDDTAADLAAIHDVDAVLEAIVQRTRAMTGSDMAYLSLNDLDRGETYIRRSDGVRTAAYRSIRMPLGTGVLGKAATGLAVVHTADYLDDPSIVHLGDIDAIVRAEGVRSILGVPMNVHGRVQGALLIADRRVLDYSPDTIEIVGTIARQAAVAIHYTARLAQVTSALADLGEQKDADLRRVQALQRVLDIDRRMVDIVVRREGVEPILGLLGSIFDARVELVGPEGTPDRPALDAALRSATAAGLPVPVAVPPGVVTLAPVAVAQRQLGWLLVDAAVGAEGREVLEHGALNVALSLLMDEIEAAAAQRTQEELLDDLRSGRVVADGALRARMASFGLDLARPLAMLHVAPDGGRAADAAALVRRALGVPALVAVHDDHVCVLHQGRIPLAAPAQEALAASHPVVRVGSARVPAGADGVARAHRSAALAVASLRLLGGTVLDGDTLGALGILLEAEASGRLPAGVTAPAQPLLDADAARGTDLTRTAWACLEFGPAVPGIAAALFIHPNTLRQRMHRIGVLLGEDWRTGHGRLDLHLALRVVMLRRTRDADARRSPGWPDAPAGTGASAPSGERRD